MTRRRNPLLALIDRPGKAFVNSWAKLGPRYLPFADAATEELPLARLLRLSLFQVSVGMAMALLVGTLNRVMIVEFGVHAWLVALMVSLPLVFSPFRALLGFRSDTHRSAFGWKRVPYIWFGSMMQFGGLSIMPFALILLSGDSNAPVWVGHAGAALAFLLVGAGLQTTQTAGLALATDLAPTDARPRAVALMYTMLLVGMVASGVVFGLLLENFSELRLIKVIQGAAVVTIILNTVAAWKQEPRRRVARAPAEEQPAFRTIWRRFTSNRRALRLMVGLGLGTGAFNMQDIILEPYGGEILGLSVSATTALTALMALGALVAFGWAARRLGRGADPHRIASMGALIGIVAFCAVIFAEPLGAPNLFRFGVLLIGFGGGLFSVGTLTAAMGLETEGFNGLAMGAWGAVQATCAGVSVALGGAIRDVVSGLAANGVLGSALATPATGYSFVYHVELYLMFATLIALGPLVRPADRSIAGITNQKFGLAQFPG